METNGDIEALNDVDMALLFRDMDELERKQAEPHAPANRRVKATRTQTFPTDQAPRQPRKMKIHTWVRRKQEITMLLAQSLEMQVDLALLKLRRERRRRKLGLSKEDADKRLRCKRVADREKQRCQAALDENKALREKLLLYSRLSKSFQAALAVTQSPEELLMPRTLRAALSTEGALPLKMGTPATFSTFGCRVNTRFSASRRLLSALMQASTTVDAEQVKMRSKDGVEGLVMEYESTRVLPFDAVATSEAAWSLVESGGIPRTQICEVRWCSQDTVTVDSRFTLPQDCGQVVTADVHCLLKRFPVPEGCILLGESKTQWTASGGSSDAWSHESQESVGLLISQLSLKPSAFTELGHRGCVMKALVRSEGHTYQTSTQPHKLAMSVFRRILNCQRQLAENKLWDSARPNSIK